MKIKISLSIFFLTSISLAHSMEEKVEVENPKDMLFKGVEKNNIDLINDALDRGVDINAIDQYGWGTALMFASIIGSKKIIEFLLKSNADVNITGNNGQTALVISIISKNSESTINLLLQAHADLEIKNTFGLTPLNYAKKSHRPELVKTFKEEIKKRKLFTQNKLTEQTPLIQDLSNIVIDYLYSKEQSEEVQPE